MPQLIHRYTAPERANHWVVAVSFVLLTLSGLALFQPEFFVLSYALGGGTWSRILHPFIGVLLALGFGRMALRYWNDNKITDTDRQWMKRIGDVIRNRDQGLPEIASTTLARSTSSGPGGVDPVAVRVGDRDVAAVFHALFHGWSGARGRAGACVLGLRRHPRADRACLRGSHMGTRQSARHDAGHGHGIVAKEHHPPGIAVSARAQSDGKHHRARRNCAASGEFPFLRLPERDLFQTRAGRLDSLAAGHALGDYLRFLAAWHAPSTPHCRWCATCLA